MAISCERFYPLIDGEALEQKVTNIWDKEERLRSDFESARNIYDNKIGRLEDDYFRIQEDFLNYTGKLFNEINSLESRVISLETQLTAKNAHDLTQDGLIATIQGELAGLGWLFSLGSAAALSAYLGNLLGNLIADFFNKMNFEETVKYFENRINETNQKLDQTNLLLQLNDAFDSIQTNEINTLKSDQISLYNGYQSLNNQVEKDTLKIVQQLNAITTELNKIDPNKYNKDIVDLQNQINSLKDNQNNNQNIDYSKQINNLETEYNKLKLAYDELLRKYNELKDNNQDDKYNDLIKKYNDLVDEFNKLGLTIQDILIKIKNFEDQLLKIDEKMVDPEAIANSLSQLRQQILSEVDANSGNSNFQLSTDVKGLQETSFKLESKLNTIEQAQSQTKSDTDNVIKEVTEVKNELNNHVTKNIPDAHKINADQTYNQLKDNINKGTEDMLQPDLDILKNNQQTTNEKLVTTGLEISTILLLTQNLASGSLNPTCRFHDDPYSPQIAQDTTQIKAAQAGHITLSASTNSTVNTMSGVVDTINTKAGTLINNGGLGGAFSRLYQTLGVDRWVSMLQTAILLHNAQMLSSNLAQTLVNLGDTALDAAGFEFKDVEGNQVSLGQVVNTTVYNLASNILGRDITDDIIDTYKRATRLYQAASSMLYALEGIMDATRDLTEISVENTGKIGNALKKWGVVGENEYPWMIDRVTAKTAFQQRINTLNQTLQDITNAVDVFEQATSNVIEIQENYKEFRDSKEIFENELKAWEQSEKTTKDSQKESSKGPSINNVDLVRQES